MKWLKRLFGIKDKKVDAPQKIVEGRMYPLPEEVYELPQIETKPTSVPEKVLSPTSAPTEPKIKDDSPQKLTAKEIEKAYLRELSKKKPKRETKIYHGRLISLYTTVYEKPEFDVTPNPKKYWRRFHKNGKTYWKKFYTEPAL